MCICAPASDLSPYFLSFITMLLPDAEQKDADMAKSRIVAACKPPYGSRFCFLPTVLLSLFLNVYYL
jgi:hypothetical protein